MRRAHLVLFLSVLAANAALAGTFEPAAEPVQDRFIVVLEERQFPPPGLTTAEIHRNNVHDVAEGLAFEYRGRRGHVYSESLVGFSVEMTPRQARALSRDPRVAAVAEDGWVRAAAHATQLTPPSWGLDRIDQRDALLDGTYQWYAPAFGTEVHAYVLDSGIRATHEDFGGRVDTENAYSSVFDGRGVDDCNGHGTHVAGILGGEKHGVAKNVTLHPVRVLDCQGRGTLSMVIAGIDWLTQRMIESPHPAVANLSLQTSPSQILDNAVKASIASGVTYVVAAGNSADSACDYSPGRVPEALTVGAANASDQIIAISSRGECVDLYAPGESIVSSFNRDDTDTLTMSGTSMAAPHVAGAIANLLAQAPFGTPAQLGEALLADAGSLADPSIANGPSALLYSLIEVDPNSALGSGGLSFTDECNPKNYRCTFVATLGDGSREVTRYYWDFGDGSFRDHKRPTMRHGYRGMTGPVDVVLTVDLADGSSYTTGRTIVFPW